MNDWIVPFTKLMRTEDGNKMERKKSRIKQKKNQYVRKIDATEK